MFMNYFACTFAPLWVPFLISCPGGGLTGSPFSAHFTRFNCRCRLAELGSLIPAGWPNSRMAFSARIHIVASWTSHYDIWQLIGERGLSLVFQSVHDRYPARSRYIRAYVSIAICLSRASTAQPSIINGTQAQCQYFTTAQQIKLNSANQADLTTRRTRGIYCGYWGS